MIASDRKNLKMIESDTFITKSVIPNQKLLREHHYSHEMRNIYSTIRGDDFIEAIESKSDLKLFHEHAKSGFKYVFAGGVVFKYSKTECLRTLTVKVGHHGFIFDEDFKRFFGFKRPEIFLYGNSATIKEKAYLNSAHDLDIVIE